MSKAVKPGILKRMEVLPGQQNYPGQICVGMELNLTKAKKLYRLFLCS
jgi:hypothetical protein